jgi:hypothetical protein
VARTTCSFETNGEEQSKWNEYVNNDEGTNRGRTMDLNSPQTGEAHYT